MSLSSASKESTRLPVLIIGAGLGGLTLAQSLSKHGIPYHIFERDSATDQRAQGYRISIDSGGTDALRAALPQHLYDRFVATCAEQHKPVGRVNAITGELERAGVAGLLTAGGAKMAWDLAKRYLGKRYEAFSLSDLLPRSSSQSITALPPRGEKDHDSVTAHFGNGTSARGSLLVGADGKGSNVAAQLIGKPATPVDLGLRIIYGKTPLNPGVEEALHRDLRRGTAFVVDDSRPDGRILMVCECMRFSHADAPPNYMFWTLCGRADAFKMQDAALLSATGADAAKIASRLTQLWDSRVRIIIDAQAIEETAVLRMSSSDPEKTTAWSTNRRVTVLGDAIHSMPPTGGQGANSAMRDAALLGQILAETGDRLQK